MVSAISLHPTNFITSHLFCPAVSHRNSPIPVLFTVPCAVGTYYHEQSRVCEPCPLGTYQSESGQLQCSVCPLIAGRQGVTIAPGARSANDCKGTYISFWLEECTKAEAVRYWPLTMEAQVWSQVSLCGVCGGHSGDGTGFSLSISVYLCHYHSSIAPYISFVYYRCHVTSAIDSIIK
jgi:hypothetical protein